MTLPKDPIKKSEYLKKMSERMKGKNGYFLIRLWESDIKKNTQGCAENVIKMIKERTKEIIKP